MKKGRHGDHFRRDNPNYPWGGAGVPDELVKVAEFQATAEDLPELAGYEPEAPEDTGDDDPYPDWTEATTRVVSGPIGQTKYPGRRAENWQAARKYAREFAETHEVRLYKFWTIPGRWFARVGREKAK